MGPSRGGSLVYLCGTGNAGGYGADRVDCGVGRSAIGLALVELVAFVALVVTFQHRHD